MAYPRTLEQPLTRRDSSQVPWLPGSSGRLAADAPGLLSLLPVMLVGFAASVLLPDGAASLVRTVLCLSITAIVMVTLWLRVIRREVDRVAWGLLAAGMTSWGLATAWGHLRLGVAIPITGADPFWMALYVAGAFQVALLRRRRLAGAGRSVLTEGLICASGAAAVAVPAWILPLAERSTSDTATIAISTFYPLAGVILLGLVLSIGLSHMGRTAQTWRFLGVGWLGMLAADLGFVWQQAFASYSWEVVPNLCYMVGVSMLGMAAWTDDAIRTSRPPSPVLLGLASLGGLTCVCVLLVGSSTSIPLVASGLAGVGLLFVGLRTRRAFLDALALADSQREAQSDPLSGLANRRLFFRSMEQALAERPTTRPMALLVLDLDRFKDVNDTFGHAQGDAVLRALAERMADVVRPDDLIARLGGDEFAVIVDGDEATAVRVAEGMASVVSERVDAAGVSLYLTISIGVAAWPAHGCSPDTLLARADLAMYEAKRRRQTVHVFTPGLEDAIRDRVRSQSLLREALRTPAAAGGPASHGLRMVYQPQVHLASGAVCGVEALMRWTAPGIGEVRPEAFVALAEDAGLIGPLTGFAIESSIEQAERWRTIGLPTRVAVNLSPTNLCEPDLVDVIEGSLLRHHLDPASLVVELTEDALISELDLAVAVLRRLQDIGVSASIDDFGRGRSSLTYLRRLPVAELKLDRSFIHDIAGDETSRAIVGSAVDVGHALGLVVVAEGVEDELTAAALVDLGVDRAQGFHYAVPMDAVDVGAWWVARSGVAVSSGPPSRQP